MQDVAYQAIGNAIFIGEHLVWPSLCAKAAYFKGAFFGELAIGVFTSARFVAAALGNAIALIIAVRSQKEMIRTKARRVIAFVANLNIGRDWSVCNLISEATGLVDRSGRPHLPISAMLTSLSAAWPFKARIIGRQIIQHVSQQLATLDFVCHGVSVSISREITCA